MAIAITPSVNASMRPVCETCSAGAGASGISVGGIGSAMLSGQAGVAQLAERQPSKLNVAGSIPVSRSIHSASPVRAEPLRLRLGLLLLRWPLRGLVRHLAPHRWVWRVA